MQERLTWGERLRAEGREEGRKEGREEARREVVLDGAEFRWGPLPAPIRQAILSADSERILILFQRVVTEASADALLEP